MLPLSIFKGKKDAFRLRADEHSFDTQDIWYLGVVTKELKSEGENI